MQLVGPIVVGLQDVGLPVLGFAVEGLIVVGIHVVGPHVVGFAVDGLTVVGFSVVGEHVEGLPVVGVCEGCSVDGDSEGLAVGAHVRQVPRGHLLAEGVALS